MKIIMMDTGEIWKPDMPALVPWSKQIVVAEAGATEMEHKALQSLAKKLYFQARREKEVLFLADSNPLTLYPVLAMKRYCKNIRMHLWVMEPLETASEEEQSLFHAMMQQMDHVQSIIYYNRDMYLQHEKSASNAREFWEKVREDFARYLPTVIERLPWAEDKENYYFDFGMERYFLVESGYMEALYARKQQREAELRPEGQLYMVMGEQVPGRYFDTSNSKEYAEQLVPRYDGKELCNMLCQMRQALAKANHINLHISECPSTGPCAGTCEKCDRELRILMSELADIPEADLSSNTSSTGIMQGTIMKISRLRMGTDGKGITTLVTFHGCPLQCKYCINDFCHEESTIRAEYTPQELVKVLAIDEPYFLMTGGGVTFGGGEPLLQADYIRQVCELIAGRWKLRVETSLNVPWENIEPLLELIDQWIIDVKESDATIYREYTGCDNEQVFQNLTLLAEKVDREKLLVRIPNIPGYNTPQEVAFTEKWVKDAYAVETEVFDYRVL